MRSTQIAIGLLFVYAAAAADSPSFAHHSKAVLDSKAQAIIRKVDGAKPAFVVLGQTANTLSALIHRAKTGDAELHDAMSDFFVVRAGAGTLVMGGQMESPRTVSPGEHAAARIIGGESRPIGPGDVIYIPSKMPHHVLLGAGQTITYVLIKAKE